MAFLSRCSQCARLEQLCRGEGGAEGEERWMRVDMVGRALEVGGEGSFF